MSISRSRAAGIAACLALLAVPATAQPRLEASPDPTVAQAGSAFYSFEAFAVASRDGRRQYNVQIAIPKREVPKGGYPVVYLLDGGAAVETLDEKLLARLGAGDPPVLVAIGYAGQPRFDTQARAYDYTPPDPDRPDAVDDQGRPGGGADAFLDLIEARIKPQVERLARIDRRRQTLWGHSYGGLAVLRAAFASKPRFQHFSAADPSLWWNYGTMLRQAQPFLTRKARTPRAIDIMAGGGSQKRREGAPAHSNAMRASLPAGTTKNLSEQLRAAGHHVRFSQCEGAGHGDMFRISLTRTLLDIATPAGSALSCDIGPPTAAP